MAEFAQHAQALAEEKLLLGGIVALLAFLNSHIVSFERLDEVSPLTGLRQGIKLVVTDHESAA